MSSAPMLRGFERPPMGCGPKSPRTRAEENDQQCSIDEIRKQDSRTGQEESLAFCSKHQARRFTTQPPAIFGRRQVQAFAVRALPSPVSPRSRRSQSSFPVWPAAISKISRGLGVRLQKRSCGWATFPLSGYEIPNSIPFPFPTFPRPKFVLRVLLAGKDKWK